MRASGAQLARTLALSHMGEGKEIVTEPPGVSR